MMTEPRRDASSTRENVSRTTLATLVAEFVARRSELYGTVPGIYSLLSGDAVAAIERAKGSNAYDTAESLRPFYLTHVEVVRLAYVRSFKLLREVSRVHFPRLRELSLAKGLPLDVPRTFETLSREFGDSLRVFRLRVSRSDTFDFRGFPVLEHLQVCGSGIVRLAPNLTRLELGGDLVVFSDERKIQLRTLFAYGCEWTDSNLIDLFERSLDCRTLENLTLAGCGPFENVDVVVRRVLGRLESLRTLRLPHSGFSVRIQEYDIWNKLAAQNVHISLQGIVVEFGLREAHPEIVFLETDVSLPIGFEEPRVWRNPETRMTVEPTIPICRCESCCLLPSSDGNSYEKRRYRIDELKSLRPESLS